eukprot:CAMPEP_0178387706 /NCGR_PEP_ID=MMETSP0689_2-20121128/9211_1 /TAXON_ID=160604 /ORGANISM="Amphidinium massartii, Strain CS-259" /LENGTH=637 /DNA_ID=CAMNT_0020008077 /DNA_START=155 /DNA_END=2068 /DNA_ORIENTATION=-
MAESAQLACVGGRLVLKSYWTQNCTASGSTPQERENSVMQVLVHGALCEDNLLALLPNGSTVEYHYNQYAFGTDMCCDASDTLAPCPTTPAPTVVAVPWIYQEFDDSSCSKPATSPGRRLIGNSGDSVNWTDDKGQGWKSYLFCNNGELHLGDQVGNTVMHTYRNRDATLETNKCVRTPATSQSMRYNSWSAYYFLDSEACCDANDKIMSCPATVSTVSTTPAVPTKLPSQLNATIYATPPPYTTQALVTPPTIPYAVPTAPSQQQRQQLPVPWTFQQFHDPSCSNLAHSNDEAFRYIDPHYNATHGAAMEASGKGADCVPMSKDFYMTSYGQAMLQMQCTSGALVMNYNVLFCDDSSFFSIPQSQRNGLHLAALMLNKNNFNDTVTNDTCTYSDHLGYYYLFRSNACCIGDSIVDCNSPPAVQPLSAQQFHAPTQAPNTPQSISLTTAAAPTASTARGHLLFGGYALAPPADTTPAATTAQATSTSTVAPAAGSGAAVPTMAPFYAALHKVLAPPLPVQAVPTPLPPQQTPPMPVTPGPVQAQQAALGAATATATTASTTASTTTTTTTSEMPWGLPWWGWFLICCGLLLLCLVCVAPAAAAPAALMGGGKKKKSSTGDVETSTTYEVVDEPDGAE